MMPSSAVAALTRGATARSLAPSAVPARQDRRETSCRLSEREACFAEPG